jgi:hypothetical protein
MADTSVQVMLTQTTASSSFNWGGTEAGLRSFNSLPFAVTLVAAKAEKDANIVVVLADGPGESYTYSGTTMTTNDRFKPDGMHGQTSIITDPGPGEIFFACTFLPGKLKETNDRQKEMIFVHEMIHASGLNSNDDHDIVGIFTGSMQKSGDGLLEYMPEKDAKPMPPIRVGSRTLCKMRMLWAGEESCKK